MSQKLDRSYFVDDSSEDAWAFLQHEKLGRAPTVRETSDAWHVTDATVREAVEEQYWMFLDGPDDDPTKQTLEHDGE